MAKFKLIPIPDELKAICIKHITKLMSEDYWDKPMVEDKISKVITKFRRDRWNKTK